MKKALLLLAGILISSISLAQFQVGHTTITFNDPSRTGGFGSGGGAGRQIQIEIYYPATVAGTDVAVANAGGLPVIVFGHGFAMSWDAYQNIWEEMAKKGFIIAFPRTESGLFPAPSHADFGKDIALVVDKMLALNATTGSLFSSKINGKAGIMGHSMGGGAAFLASANNPAIKTVVGLAPAQTNPSASAAAANVTVPALILSGTNDGVTPAADHHTLIYNGLASDCKYFLNLIGGGHCLFANTNFNCDFGESTTSTGITLTRAQQQAIMFDYIIPWFSYYLIGDCNAWELFVDPQATDTRITPLSSCPTVAPIVPVITMGNNVLISDVTTNIQWYKDQAVLVGETNATLPLTYGSGSYTVENNYRDNCSLFSFPYVYDATTTGIEENAFGNSTAIYPNPTSDFFTISISNELPFLANIYTVDGKLIQTSSATSELKIESTTWNSGVYFVELIQGNSKITKRISKY